ncbi:FtsL-like putative cell division protein [Pedobacter alpinus]|uniref:FtsL-like putative cell division protein n=1 Tax=Pedobacter alpinus TaxID=1590643 RepID=A0ABW5TQK3_9SPHI
MTNRLKSEIEAEKKLAEPAIAPQKQMPEAAPNFFTVLLSKKAFSKESATEALPFLLFLAFLGMVYIGNRHSAENNIRKIDGLNKEVKELSWDFKTLKADLMFKSRQTEVILKVDSLLGLKVSVQPPIKLKAN